MAYIKTNWINGEVPLSESNLNKIEQGIYDAHKMLDIKTKTFSHTLNETIPAGRTYTYEISLWDDDEKPELLFHPTVKIRNPENVPPSTLDINYWQESLRPTGRNSQRKQNYMMFVSYQNYSDNALIPDPSAPIIIDITYKYIDLED